MRLQVDVLMGTASPRSSKEVVDVDAKIQVIDSNSVDQNDETEMAVPVSSFFVKTSSI